MKFKALIYPISIFIFFSSLVISVLFLDVQERHQMENTELVKCIEKKFDNNEFTKEELTFSAYYYSDNITINLARDYDEGF